MSNYEDKRKARIDRLNEAAKRAEIKAHNLFDSSDKMASAIPFGQPILAGHHSEQRDRNYRRKIEKTMEKAVNTYEYAKELRRRAEAAEKNTAISSDDPKAIEKLKEKLANLQEYQEEMKCMNRHYRKSGTCKGYKDISESEAEKFDERIKSDYSWQQQPYPGFLLTNNNANIRRIRERIHQLEKIKEMDFGVIEFSGGKVIPNKDANRLQIFFDNIPAPDIRAEMKGRGFRFSKYNNNAWQRQLNSNAIYDAKLVIKKIEELANQQPEDKDFGLDLDL